MEQGIVSGNGEFQPESVERIGNVGIGECEVNPCKSVEFNGGNDSQLKCGSGRVSFDNGSRITRRDNERASWREGNRYGIDDGNKAS